MIKKCDKCRRDFETKRGDTIFCSNACRDLNKQEVKALRRYRSNVIQKSCGKKERRSTKGLNS